MDEKYEKIIDKHLKELREEKENILKSYEEDVAKCGAENIRKCISSYSTSLNLVEYRIRLLMMIKAEARA